MKLFPKISRSSKTLGVSASKPLICLHENENQDREQSGFRNWRVQGQSIRHNKVGGKLTPIEAKSIMDMMLQNGMRGHYDSTKGSVEINSGTLSDLLDLEASNGAVSISAEKLSAEKAAKEAAKTEVDAQRARELAANPASSWIDETFGADSLNTFNKLEFAKFLTGETQKFAGGTSPKFREAAEKLGVSSMDEIKAAYNEHTIITPAPPLNETATHFLSNIPANEVDEEEDEPEEAEEDDEDDEPEARIRMGDPDHPFTPEKWEKDEWDRERELESRD